MLILSSALGSTTQDSVADAPLLMTVGDARKVVINGTRVAKGTLRGLSSVLAFTMSVVSNVPLSPAALKVRAISPSFRIYRAPLVYNPTQQVG